ncbi:MAG: 2Fe-2S iron-sulfur cluster-binding protein [Deltaproteobacteria bacterium]
MMPEVYSQTDQKTFHVSLDDTILEASRKAGIHHMHVCGGNARCSTCRVYVMEGLENCLPRNDKEKALAEKLSFSDHIRLACQTRISGDIVIRRPVIDDLDIEIILRQLEDGPGSKLGRGSSAMWRGTAYWRFSASWKHARTRCGMPSPRFGI